MAKQKKSAGKNAERAAAQECCLVVGIGASAGGLDAMQRFFSALPAKTKAAYVIVQHMDPDHPSLLAEVLARHTDLPITEVTSETVAQPDHVYLAQPGDLLSISGGALITRGNEARNFHSIDHFFNSLAEDQQQNAVAIVLSGAATDGTAGIRAIKRNHGFVLAQDPATAKYPSMPESAISTGLVDEVHPPEQFPARIVQYERLLTMLYDEKCLAEVTRETSKGLDIVYEVLNKETGHDFSRYKQSTILRRIHRRMQSLRIGAPREYFNLLRNEPAEAIRLFKDILIGVTQFFRDPEAFDVLESEIIPKLFANKTDDQPVRAWVPACSTGEEAYSLAILLKEYARKHDRKNPIQVFATDIDRHAIETARRGRYPLAVVESIRPEFLDRYFIQTNAQIHVSRELRDCCMFSSHNLIKDPPFSRMDLISCRNLLIYMEVDLQKRLMPLFHMSLSPGAYLFLGTSESIGSYPELFGAIDKKQRIFQKKNVLTRPQVKLPFLESRMLRQEPVPGLINPVTAGTDSVGIVAQRVLLDSFTPPSVIINEQSDIVYFSGRTGKYLEPPAGAPRLNILDMAHHGLRLVLRSAIHRAISTREQVVHRDLAIEIGTGIQKLNLIVRPMKELGESSNMFLVVFQETGDYPTVELARMAGIQAPPEDSIARQLEHELRITRDRLQSTIEELETSNEELKASNEELLSMNEELQSANEELQTSEEELRQVTDQLREANENLTEKIIQLNEKNNDLRNLFLSTQTATVFLDSDLHIKGFTPAAREVFRLIDTDVGRPITDIQSRIDFPELLDAVRKTIRTEQDGSLEVRRPEDNASFILRLNPYRTMEGAVLGAVLTFIDVTEVKRTQRGIAHLAAIVEGSQDAIFAKNLQGIIQTWNPAAEALYGYTAEEAIGMSAQMLIPEDLRQEMIPTYEKIRRGEIVDTIETFRRRKDGSLVSASVKLSAIRDTDGEVIGVSSIARDLSSRDAAAEKLRISEERYRSLVASASSIVFIADPNGAFNTRQTLWEEYTGAKWEDYKDFNWLNQIHPDDRESVRALWNQPTPRAFRAEGRLWNAAANDYRYSSIRAVPVHNSDNTVREWVGMIIDSHERVLALRKSAEGERHLRRLLDSLSVYVFVLSPKGELTEINQAPLEGAGLRREELLGKSFAQCYWWNYSDEVSGQMQKALRDAANGSPARFDVLARRSDDQYITLDFTLNPIKDESGQVSTLVACGVDVSERVRERTAVLEAINESLRKEIIERERADAELAETQAQLEQRVKDRTAELARALEANSRSNAQLETVVNNISQGLIIASRDGRIARINPAAAQFHHLLGFDSSRFTVEEFSKTMELSLHDGTPLSPDQWGISEALRGRYVTSRETRVKSKLTGQTRYARVSATPVFDKEGEVDLAIVVMEDITEQKLAEEEMRINRERFDLLINSSNLGIWFCNLPFEKLEWNDRVREQFFAKPKDDITIEFFFDRLHPDDRESTRFAIQQSIENKALMDTEYRTVSPDGLVTKYIRAIGRPFYDETGKPIRFDGITFDMTPQRRAEEERRRFEAQFQQAQKMESLGILAGGIAHDFNNLLVGILGNAGMALEELDPALPAVDYVRGIETASKRAAELCRQMLAYSGKGRFFIEPVNINSLIEEMHELLSSSISKKAFISFNFAANLPTIEADATQIRQVVMNLITNASEALGDKSGSITITTGVMYCDRAALSNMLIDEYIPEGDYVYLEIADTGCGMDEETATRIFDPFFTTKFTGRGLGLAAVLGIVRGHKGAMRVSSQIGSGTTFTIMLPAQSRGIEVLPKPSMEPREWTKGGTVLLVDDSETVRAVGSRMLENAGFTVLLAEDGLAAVELFAKYKDEIDCILLDLTMPRMDGHEAFHEFRKISSNVPVILSSGYNEQEAVHLFVGEGLWGFVQKPYQPIQLVNAVHEAIEERIRERS